MTLVQLRQYIQEELTPFFENRELKNHISILFEYFLKMNRASQLISLDQEVDESDIKEIKSAVAELKKSKPIDYIIKQSIFFGYEFYVDSRVLIPRSETEELVQWILEEEQKPELTVLDIGSGSGCIPITLELEGTFKQVDALEVSAEANEVARINAKQLSAKVKFEEADILTQTPNLKYDVVVSNPPYVKEEELEQLDKNVVEYEPGIALAPKGDDPLLFYKRMIAIAPDMLKVGGRMYWEIHEDLGEQVVDLLRNANFKDIELRQDLYNRDRLVRASFQ